MRRSHLWFLAAAFAALVVGCMMLTATLGVQPTPRILFATEEGTSYSVTNVCIRLTGNGAADDEAVRIEAIGIASEGPAVVRRAVGVQFDDVFWTTTTPAPSSPGATNEEVTVELDRRTPDRRPVLSLDGSRRCFNALFTPAEVRSRPAFGTDPDPTLVPLSGTRVRFGIGAGDTGTGRWMGYGSALHIEARGVRSGRLHYFPTTVTMGPEFVVRRNGMNVIMVDSNHDEPRSQALSRIPLVNGRRDVVAQWRAWSGRQGEYVMQKMVTFAVTINRDRNYGSRLQLSEFQVERGPQVLDPSYYRVYDGATGADLRNVALGNTALASERALVVILFRDPQLFPFSGNEYRVTAIPRGGQICDHILTTFWSPATAGRATGALTEDTFRLPGGERQVGPFIRGQDGTIVPDGFIWSDDLSDTTGNRWATGEFVLDELIGQQLRTFGDDCPIR